MNRVLMIFINDGYIIIPITQLKRVLMTFINNGFLHFFVDFFIKTINIFLFDFCITKKL